MLKNNGQTKIVIFLFLLFCIAVSIAIGMYLDSRRNAVPLKESHLAQTDPVDDITIWTEDFEKAKATAAAEGKDLLVDFTGSDWCSWCKKLDKEVFDADLFIAESPRHFVNVTLDYPTDKSRMSQETITQNELLKEPCAILHLSVTPVRMISQDGAKCPSEHGAKFS